MRKSLRLATALSLASLAAAPARAALSPIGLGVLPPVQFPSEEVTITGARISALWGHHRNVYGFDIGGLGNITDLNFGGIQVAGLVNRNRGGTNIVGLQLAGLANWNGARTTVIGVQAALGLNSAPGEGTYGGLQVAAIANIVPHAKIIGAQVGLYNSARAVYGLQIGLVNVADELHGLQIGLVNVHKQGLFPICPAINFGF